MILLSIISDKHKKVSYSGKYRFVSYARSSINHLKSYRSLEKYGENNRYTLTRTRITNNLTFMKNSISISSRVPINILKMKII